MNELKQLYERVKKHPKSKQAGYLVHFFCMLDPNLNPAEAWQIGLYNKEKDLITTFVMDTDITLREGKPFKKKSSEIHELYLDKVKINFKKAVEQMLEFQKTTYPNQDPGKTWVLLQVLDKNPIWNMTFVTKTFNTLNIKLDATTGEVIDHNLSNLLQWGSGAKQGS